MARPDAIVVGAGISGLTTAYLLLEAGLRVELWARDRPPHTTSDVAAAFWYPMFVDPSPRVDRWAVTSYRRFMALADRHESGVVLREVHELLGPAPGPAPAWRSCLEGLRPLEPHELPRGPGQAAPHDPGTGVVRRGRRFVAPVIETPRYLPWLCAQIEAMGGIFRARTLHRLEEALAVAPRVVNASGLGARTLAPDARVVALEGLLLKLERGAEAAPIDRRPVLLDESDPSAMTYVVPRQHDVVLGGSARVVDPPPPEPKADPAVLLEIERRARTLDPTLPRDTARRVDLGYRPYRGEIRLEVEASAGGWIGHNYGHGGAGVTLSWGCAAELSSRLLGRPLEDELRGDAAGTRPAAP